MQNKKKEKRKRKSRENAKIVVVLFFYPHHPIGLLIAHLSHLNVQNRKRKNPKKEKQKLKTSRENTCKVRNLMSLNKSHMKKPQVC